MTKSAASRGRVFLTGASGFIGRAAISPLRAAGFDVHAAARHPFAAAGEATWHACNLLDEEAMRRAVAQVRPTHLLHLAWYTEPGKYWTAPENHDWLRASKALVEVFAKSGGQRIVCAGTCGEYDWSHSGTYSERGTPIVPATLYGQAKNDLREHIESFARVSGVSAGWGRVFFPFGAHEHPSRLVASVIDALLEGRSALCSPGEQVRDFVLVQDVADALVALLDSDVEHAVNIGSGQGIAVKDVALKIGALLERPELIKLGARPAPQNEPAIIIADTRRLRDEVGFKADNDLEAGLKKSIAWWRGRLSAGQRATT